jgi:hypothetical protein
MTDVQLLSVMAVHRSEGTVKAVQYSAVLHVRCAWLTSSSTMTAPPLKPLIVTPHRSLHGVDTSSKSSDEGWKPLHRAMLLDGADQGHNRVPCCQTGALVMSLSATPDCSIVDAVHQLLEKINCTISCKHGHIDYRLAKSP